MIAAAAPALAHRGEAQRELRLQIQGSTAEGLLRYTLPAGIAAKRLLAAPPGLVPGERAQDPLEQTLGKRAAAEALRGLRFSIGADQGSLRPAAITLIEAKGRQTATGGLEALLLVRLEAAILAPSVLEIATGGGGPRIRAALGAVAPLRTSLISGVGKARPGGLTLRPRPGMPCRVQITSGD